MTVTDQPTSSRHLVDPELLPLADSFPALHLGPESLPLVRAGMEARPPADPSPADLYPDVTMTERHVPGYHGDPDVRILHYEPASRVAPTAALVWMHGGGFVLGQAELNDLLCRQIVDATGASVVSVDYRLAPETRAPGLLHDCYAALQWVHGNADDLEIDTRRIAVGGLSAGGGLAASLSILARDLDEIPISFQLLVYPMLDDRTGTTTAPDPYVGEFVWTPSDNRFGWTAHLGCEPGGDVPATSAAARVASVEGLPPAFIAVGSLDLFLHEDVDYAIRLLRAGIPTELHVYPGAIHAFDQMPIARVSQAHLSNLLEALRRRWDEGTE